jgi:hypothetical protein
MKELKYVLTRLIPDGKKEKLNSALELFRFLEQQEFVGENNLDDLEELFRQMDKPKLCQMVTKYIRGRHSQTAGKSMLIMAERKGQPICEYK